MTSTSARMRDAQDKTEENGVVRLILDFIRIILSIFTGSPQMSSPDEDTIFGDTTR